ncbi:hypothetical protein V6S02_08295 [Microbacterium sp. CCNWLW134]|uniref:hypothetical protein n=1 Tax=Microbacterium sp. CCNWLW134 TaxID=3122064 RepID=UPI0030103CDE
MAGGLTASLTGRRTGAVLFRHPALFILLLYIAARGVTTSLFLLTSAWAPAGSRFGPGAGLADYIVGWDAQWYWLIAVEGYPAQLPRDDEGTVGENAWAFMPVFALLARVVGAPLGAWGAGGVLVALAAGYGCCVLMWMLLRERIGRIAAMWAVAFFAFAPLAAMFQVAYAETLFLLLLLWILRGLQTRRYGWIYPAVVLMAYTRPGVLAVALLFGLYGIWRLATRRSEPLRRVEIVHILALGALATATGFSWTFIAGAVTADPTAYLDTELAWRRVWVGDTGGFLPFEGWAQAAQFWFVAWGLPAWLGFVVLGLGVVVVGGLLLFEPHVARLGIEVRLWAASYLVYLLAVFFPQSSVFRLLFPLSPLWGAFATPRHPVWRGSVLVLCVVGQWWWIWNMYGLGTSFWQIP